MRLKSAKNIEKIEMKKFTYFNCFLKSAVGFRIRLLKFLFSESRSGRKWTGSANLSNCKLSYEYVWLKFLFIILKPLIYTGFRVRILIGAIKHVSRSKTLL